MYFANIPAILYSLDNKNVEVVTDIITRAQLASGLKGNVELYLRYDVLDGETPEMVSYKFYGSPLYHWVILIINEIIDPIGDWFVPGFAFEQMLDEKYEDPDSVAYYVDDTGVVVDGKKELDLIRNLELAQNKGYADLPYSLLGEVPFNIRPVTFREDEYNKNILKKNIKILNPQLLQPFVAEFKRVMGA